MIAYLASPYSHVDPTVQVKRFEQVCEYAAHLMREGEIVYSPIAHTHPIAKYNLPQETEFWLEFDKHFLHVAQKLIVYMLPGWRISRGVASEIKMAVEAGLPIEYHEPLPEHVTEKTPTDAEAQQQLQKSER